VHDGVAVLDPVRRRATGETVDGDQPTVVRQLDPPPFPEMVHGFGQDRRVVDELRHRHRTVSPQGVEAPDSNAPDGPGHGPVELGVVEEIDQGRRHCS
jgi:hypothetical protein